MTRIFPIFVTAFLLIACQASEAPPLVRDTPAPTEGTESSPSCQGLTARGECRQGKATYCDLREDRVRQIDCRTRGDKCIIDLGRGAVCEALEPEPDPPSDNYTSPCTDTGISERGFCTSESVAVYCDTQGSYPVTRSWSCGETGMYCSVGECASGAFCCGTPTEPEPEPEPEPDPECDIVGFAGVCDNTQGGRYCLNGTVLDFACYGNKTCGEGTCGFGAQCCDNGDPVENECTMLGVDGICTEDGEVRYCLESLDEQIIQYTCGEGESCLEDVCGPGANCCP